MVTKQEEGIFPDCKIRTGGYWQEKKTREVYQGSWESDYQPAEREGINTSGCINFWVTLLGPIQINSV